MVSSRDIVGSLYVSTISLYNERKNDTYSSGTIVLVVDWEPTTETVYFLLDDHVKKLNAWSFHTIFRKLER